MNKEEKKLAKNLLKKHFKKQKPHTHHLLSFRIWNCDGVNEDCVEVIYSVYFKPLLYPILIPILTPIIFFCCAFSELHSFGEAWSDLFLSFKRKYTKKFHIGSAYHG